MDIPFGWEAQNRNYTEPRDSKLLNLSIAASKATSVDEEIRLLKEFISFYYEYKDECERKGVFFAKHFEEQFTYANKKRDVWITTKKSRLEELELGYLDIKEKQAAVEGASATIKNDLIRVILANPGILQKDLYSHFDPNLKELIYNTLYELLQEKRLRKEKEGNTNRLYII